MKRTLSPSPCGDFFCAHVVLDVGVHQEHDQSNPWPSRRGLHSLETSRVARCLLLQRPSWARPKTTRVESRAEVLIIPVVFHIIHFNGPENISNAQILDAVDVLNTNMRALNDNIGDVIPNSEISWPTSA